MLHLTLPHVRSQIDAPVFPRKSSTTAPSPINYSLHGRTNLDHLRAVFCVEALTKSAAEILSSALAAVSELTQKRSGTTCSIAIIAERLDDNAMVILQSTIAEKELSGSVGVFGSRSDMPELWHCSDIALM